MVTVFYECGGGVNLDGEDTDALTAFRVRVMESPVTVAAEIFPCRPIGALLAVRLLAKYSLAIVSARETRLQGNLAGALVQERIADRIYATLPPFAKW